MSSCCGSVKHQTATAALTINLPLLGKACVCASCVGSGGGEDCYTYHWPSARLAQGAIKICAHVEKIVHSQPEATSSDVFVLPSFSVKLKQLGKGATSLFLCNSRASTIQQPSAGRMTSGPAWLSPLDGDIGKPPAGTPWTIHVKKEEPPKTSQTQALETFASQTLSSSMLPVPDKPREDLVEVRNHTCRGICSDVFCTIPVRSLETLTVTEAICGARQQTRRRVPPHNTTKPTGLSVPIGSTLYDTHYTES